MSEETYNREEITETALSVLTGDKRKKLLLGEKVNASLGNIIHALCRLTAVELRMWSNAGLERI